MAIDPVSIGEHLPRPTLSTKVRGVTRIAIEELQYKSVLKKACYLFRAANGSASHEDLLHSFSSLPLMERLHIRRSVAKPVSRSPEVTEGKGVCDVRIQEGEAGCEDSQQPAKFSLAASFD